MEEYSPEGCAWCHGSGDDPKSSVFGPPNVCPVCSGQGSIVVVQPAMRCSRCRGTGRDTSAVYDLKVCPVCGGSGWAHTKIQRYSRSDSGIGGSNKESQIYEEERNRQRIELDASRQQAEEARRRELERLQGQAEDARQNEYEILQKINEVKNLISKGNYYFENNLYNEAILCYEESIRIRPNVTAWVRKGLVLFKQTEFEKAIKCYIEAIWINPDISDAWNYRGVALGELGKFDEAIKCFNECIRLEPNNSLFYENKQKAFNHLMKNYKTDVISWRAKGKEFFNQKKYDEAIWCYDEHLKLESQDASAWKEKSEVLHAMGKSNEARRCHAIAWNLQGNLLTSSGKHNEAIECYNEAIKIDPNDITYQTNKSKAFKAATKTNTHDAASWSAKGKDLLNKKKYDEAIWCYDEAIKLNPRNPSMWNNKGNSFFARGNYNDAIRCYAESNRLEPSYAEAWNNKGSAFAKQGRYDEAVICYDSAIKIDPKNNVYQNNKRKAFISASSIDAHDAYSWINKGNVFFGQKKFSEAVLCYDEALVKYDPNSIVALHNKGAALFNLSRFDLAIGCYNEILRIDPNHIDVWTDKGEALIGLGRYSEAIKCFEKIIKLDLKSTNLPYQLLFRLKEKPELAKAWQRKGEALAKLGNSSEAEIAFAEAKRLGYV